MAAISDISTGQNAKQTHKGKTGHGIAIMRHTANSDKRSGDTSGQTDMNDARIKRVCLLSHGRRSGVLPPLRK